VLQCGFNVLYDCLISSAAGGVLRCVCPWIVHAADDSTCRSGGGDDAV